MNRKAFSTSFLYWVDFNGKSWWTVISSIFVTVIANILRDLSTFITTFFLETFATFFAFEIGAVDARQMAPKTRQAKHFCWLLSQNSGSFLRFNLKLVIKLHKLGKGLIFQNIANYVLAQNDKIHRCKEVYVPFY